MLKKPRGPRGMPARGALPRGPPPADMLAKAKSAQNKAMPPVYLQNQHQISVRINRRSQVGVVQKQLPEQQQQ